MQFIIYLIVFFVLFYFVFKMIDFHLPKKVFKDVVLLRKHIESHMESKVDQAGHGLEFNVQRAMLTVESNEGIQTEVVSMESYSKAKVGQNVKIVKVISRFTKNFIRFDFEI